MKILIKGHTLYLHKILCLLAYKTFAQFLPVSYHYGKMGRLSRWLRYQLCRRIFLECGTDVNVEHRANFGTGFRLRIGNGSSIGIHSSMPNNVRIGDNVMMGPRCRILFQNHVYARVDIPKWQQGMYTPPPIYRYSRRYLDCGGCADMPRQVNWQGKCCRGKKCCES